MDVPYHSTSRSRNELPQAKTDSPDAVTFTFESPSQDRVSEYEMKLMDIDSEHLGIPDTDHEATVKMPAGEFQRIVRVSPFI